MVDTAGVLQVQQLVELLAVVSSLPDEESAVRGAAERAAQALEAEVAAVIVDGRVAASVGYPSSAKPDEDLLAAADRRIDSLDVPGVGACRTVGARWGNDAQSGYLLLARGGDEGFSVEEMNLVRGMARLLELTLRMLRTLATEHAMRERSERQARENADLLASLQQRQRLLEHLFDIQRAISRRKPLDEILDTVVAAAKSLLGDDVIGLWLRDDGAAEDRARLAAFAGLDPEIGKRLPAVLLSEAGIAGMAMRDDRFMVEHGAATPSILDQLTAQPLSGSMAAPVHESGVVTGCLLVGSHVPERQFEESEQQMLRALAEHVSLALTDAHTVDRMYQAFHDSLTGLASRALFLDRLSTALIDARRDGATTALLFVDLDRFKSINDTLGHAVGDQVLMATAERLREQLRAGDLAARLGGDEFAIVLSGITGPASAVAVADRLVEALADPVLAGGRWLPMLASIGIALCGPGEMESAELIRRADVAMYQAKRGGRGRHAMYTGEIEQAFATGLAS